MDEDNANFSFNFSSTFFNIGNCTKKIKKIEIGALGCYLPNTVFQSDFRECERVIADCGTTKAITFSTLHQTEQNISKQRRLLGILLFRLLSQFLLYPSFIYLLPPPLNKEVSLKNNSQKINIENLSVYPNNSVFPFFSTSSGVFKQSSSPILSSPPHRLKILETHVQELYSISMFLIKHIIKPFKNMYYFSFKFIKNNKFIILQLGAVSAIEFAHYLCSAYSNETVLLPINRRKKLRETNNKTKWSNGANRGHGGERGHTKIGINIYKICLPPILIDIIRITFSYINIITKIKYWCGKKREKLHTTNRRKYRKNWWRDEKIYTDVYTDNGEKRYKYREKREKERETIGTEVWNFCLPLQKFQTKTNVNLSEYKCFHTAHTLSPTTYIFPYIFSYNIFPIFSFANHNRSYIIASLQDERGYKTKPLFSEQPIRFNLWYLICFFSNINHKETTNIWMLGGTLC